MIKYKLTDQENKTFNNTKWGNGVTHESDGSGELCSPGWLHYYHSPLLAVLLNPIHADIPNPKLWECKAEGRHKDDYGLKGGCTKLTTLHEIAIPKISTEQSVKFAILCTKEVYKGEAWNAWADEWLSGKDRSKESAYIIYRSHYDTNNTHAAYAAVGAAYAIKDVYFVAGHVACATYHASNAAIANANVLDLKSLAEQAVS